MDAQRFPIRVGRRSRPILQLFTATPETAYADLGDELDIHFGRFQFRTPVANLDHWRIEGPFIWVKAIGVRMSVRGRDVSFAGSAHGGVRINFRERVRWGPFRVPAVWVGADDLDGFAAELTRRGIPGVDARRGRST